MLSVNGKGGGETEENGTKPALAPAPPAPTRAKVRTTTEAAETTAAETTAGGGGGGTAATPAPTGQTTLAPAPSAPTEATEPNELTEPTTPSRRRSFVHLRKSSA